MSADRGWGRGRRGRGRFHSSGTWRGGRNQFRDHPYGNSGGSRGDRQAQTNSLGAQRHRFKRPKREFPTKRLSEEDIAVTEYISKHSGFNGIIKSRYSDFQVSEINMKGEIAKLTNLTPPKPPVEETTVMEDEDLLLNKYNLEILPMETWDKINKLADSSEATDERVEIDGDALSKEQRTKIHEAVKKAFGDIIIGKTVNEGTKKLICFEKYRKGVRVDDRVKWIWPGEYVHFIVHKENCDTMEAAAKIADRLRLNLKPGRLGYAGTKDRRAKTSQWFSLRTIDPKRVAAVCAALPHLHVGNFTFQDYNLTLGMLQGNRFRIALRNVTAEDDVINTACSDLKENGFINYYGLQRFGTRIDMPTYQIGLKILQGRYKEAAQCIAEEREQSREAKRVAVALAQCPTDHLRALHVIPRNTRLLYLHAYQSLQWNRAATLRVKQHGLKPVVGDLVLDAAKPEDVTEEVDVESEDSEEEETDLTKIDIEALENNVKALKHKRQKGVPKAKVPVKVLMQADVDSGKYTIFDVVLPLPGYNVEYPPNLKDYYQMLLTKDGLTLEMKHKMEMYSMAGAYRALVVRPRALEWSCVRYDDPLADLILSDYDELAGEQLTGVKEDGKYKALILDMTLPASCYATMALRELLRMDTSGDKQAMQNNYHKSDTTEPGDKDMAESADATEANDANNKDDGEAAEKIEYSIEY